MKFYETTYILHPALQEGRLNDIISTVENKIKSFGANILYTDTWGRKKLSYLIDKQKYGTYIFFQFKLDEVKYLSEISQEFEHNPNILRYLIIQIEETDIKEKKSNDDSTKVSKQKKTKSIDSDNAVEKKDDKQEKVVEQEDKSSEQKEVIESAEDNENDAKAKVAEDSVGDDDTKENNEEE